MTKKKSKAPTDSPWRLLSPRIPVVGIGASAGGIKALQKFFEQVPPNVGAAYVVIIHLDPEHRSELPQILASRSRMPVSTGHVHLAING